MNVETAPAVNELARPLKPKCVAAPALTVMVFETPLMLAVVASVAVIVRGPAVFKVTLKLPVPPLKVPPPSVAACGSVLVSCTVPL